LTAETAVLSGGPSLAALAAVEDVLNQILYAVSAALLTDDARPVAETSAWIAELMQTRGVSTERIRELGELVAAALVDYPQARELVSRHL
jgi:MerR family transcriptional regulator, light-induced transcriptional regulator